MADSERAPLISQEAHHDGRPEATEASPLLANAQDHADGPDGQEEPASQQSWWKRRRQGPKKSTSEPEGGWRWASIISGLIMAVLVIVVLLCGFLVPGAIKVYAENAAVLEPTSLSVESITNDGVQARIRANFRLDGSRVNDLDARRIGRLATGLMRKLETEETRVNVHLPYYNNSLLGSAVVPPLTVDIIDGHSTALDFVTDLTPGDADNIRKIANEWLDGKLDQLKVTGSASIHLKSGIIPLGSHSVVESMVFEASKIPSIPEYNIERLNFHEVPLGKGGQQAVGANVSLSAHNDYPVGLDVPPLSFQVLLENCDSSEPFIAVAEAVTDRIEVRPNADVHAGALGMIREIPESLTRACPMSKLSPLDHFMDHYLHGEDAQVWIRGTKVDNSDTPEWITSILQNIMVPIAFPGGSFGDVIRNFTATDVSFKMPSPFADPGDPDAIPRVSGTIEVLASLPEEFNLDMGIDKIKSDADLYFEGDKLGELNMRRFEDANSTKVEVDGETLMNVTSHIEDVPLEITDNSVFSSVLQKMLLGGEDVLLQVQAAVDVKVGTVLGNIPLKGIPANGTIPVKPLSRGAFNALNPQVDDFRVLNTSETGASMRARINFTNPLSYTASIPHLNVHVLSHGKVIGEAIATNLELQLGNNTGSYIEATWDPITFGGTDALEDARQLLSDYVSGRNTTLEVRTHRGSIPGMPHLGEALTKLNLTVSTPRLRLPGDDADGDSSGDGHFVRDATFHLLSSTATFSLASPLQEHTVFLDYINATAFFNHTEIVGRLITSSPIAVPPGVTRTRKLPVSLSPGGIGYDKLREALGGKLNLDGAANVTLRIGSWVEQIQYSGEGIGAKVRI